MSEVTRILSAIEHGHQKAADELLPLVYTELRRLAAHKMAHLAPGQTLQPTALVHERLIFGWWATKSRSGMAADIFRRCR